MGAPRLKDSTTLYSLEIIRGPHVGTTVDFSKGSIFIGRGPENDLVLSADPRVSRQHAEIKQQGNEFVIVNLSQKNFILVDGQNVQSEVLHRGMVVDIGDSQIRFEPNVAIEAATPAASSPKASNQVSSLRMEALQPLPFSPPSAPSSFANAAPSVTTKPPPVAMPSAAIHYNVYQPPPPMSSVGNGGMDKGKVRFYAIVAVVALLGIFLFTREEAAKRKDANAIRTTDVAMLDIADAQKKSEEMLNQKKEKYDTIQYRRAQENFVRAFRDFEQGQYARAREAFQVVLNLDPDNELAKRYYMLSKIKFDEMVKMNMIQGARYKEKNNWRMCQSSYSVVMTMLQGRKDDLTYKEAKQYYDECTLNMEGRY